MADTIVMSITRTNASTVTVRDIAPGSTVGEVLKAAGIDPGSFGIALNGSRATVDTTVTTSGLISLVGAVKGGN